MNSQGQRLFFSYSREDSRFALKLAESLRSAGVHLWIDQLDIPAGARWDQSVESALKECPRLILILSPASVESQNVMDEINFAIGQNRTILPVLYQECSIPFRLNRLQRLDFTGNFDSAFEKLLAALENSIHADDETEALSTKRFKRKILTSRQVLFSGAATAVIGLAATLIVIRDRPYSTPGPPPQSNSCYTQSGYPLGRWGVSIVSEQVAKYSNFINFTEPTSGTWLPSPGNGKGTFAATVAPFPGKSVDLTLSVEIGDYKSKSSVIVSPDGCRMSGTFLDSAGTQGEVFLKWQPNNI